MSLCLLLSGCATAPAPEASKKEAPPSIPEIRAELIASDPSWGNTEGPALDSKNNLYFTSRGTWKGIVRWNKTEGAQRYAGEAVGVLAGNVPAPRAARGVAEEVDARGIRVVLLHHQIQRVHRVLFAQFRLAPLRGIRGETTSAASAA